MDKAKFDSICRLAIAGEQAGFTLQQMLDLLHAGVEVPTLVALIEWKLNHNEAQPPPSSSRWVCPPLV